MATGSPPDPPARRPVVVCHLQTEQGSLGEIVKVDHHKENFVTLDNHTVDVNFNNLSLDMRSLLRAVSQSFGIMQTVTSTVRFDVNDCLRSTIHMQFVVVLVRAMSVLYPSSRSSRSNETIPRQAADLFDAPYWRTRRLMVDGVWSGTLLR